MSLFNDLMGGLAAPQPGRSRRISSNEQPNWNDGNFDMTFLLPGQALEMPLLEGPGVIAHIWMTSHAGAVSELDALSLRIYWDGREDPGVEAPLGLFFAVGQGSPAPVESVPVQVSESGSLSCYWRMPFAESARIVVTNDNPDRATGLYWQVDWVKLEEIPPDTPYFYARYRQEYPAVMGRDYLLADLKGKGHYVGTTLAVTMAQDGWFGEGDDFFYIDGEAVPSLQGTGTEDYFNDAWGYRARTGPWFGQPRWQGYAAGDSGVCYRWHILDPVRFERSLKATIEHKGNRAESEDGFFIERPDFYASVAYWYQTGEPISFAHIPPWPERRFPWQPFLMARAFRHARLHDRSTLSIDTRGLFGARPSLSWKVKEAGDSLEIPFETGEPGRYAVRLAAFPAEGRFTVSLDGGETDLPIPPRQDESDLPLGTYTLAAGPHTLTVTAQEPGLIALERLRLLRLPPEAVREVKTDNEAHFYRLGIGRAVYAYRLVNDSLPESLGTLHEQGFLPARYLNDENGSPLLSRLENGFLTVRSSAPGGWIHRWQGLDARR
ncbi:MAG: DUF2961 domain-containing protein [Armatimonadetes bacterium]|nr:DUF2961 domain-containing protein [Armatimonadota bacterium]